MKVREYIEYKGIDKSTELTFICAVAKADEHTPFYHAEYVTTPIQTINEWEKYPLMDYNILNDKQTPIDWLSGAQWKNKFDKGILMCMLVISDEDLEKLYHGAQAERILEHIEKVIKESEVK